MLNDLFSEDGQDANVWTKNYSKRQAKKSLSYYPRSENASGLCGIQNQGATCYLNSLIQTLLFTPEFRDAVFSIQDIEKTIPTDGSRSIPIELQKLFTSLLLLDQTSVKTVELTDSFGWTDNEQLAQHDVQELNKLLCEEIEDSLNGTPDSRLIDNIYRGTSVNRIECKECGHRSERNECFLDLTVPVAGYSSLQEALSDLYLNTEQLSGDNQYKCDKCDKLVDAEKGCKLKDLPPIVTICLQRLAFDYKTLTKIKETSKFTFPEQLSMAAFLDDEGEGCNDYELLSVIIHKGGAQGGHYHTIIKDIDHLGKWNPPTVKMKPEYKRLPSKKEQEVFGGCHLSADAVEAVKALLMAYSPSDFVKLDAIFEFIKDAGGSWSKNYRKKYGALKKFLQARSEVFDYQEQGYRVRLQPLVEVEERLKQTDINMDTSAETVSVRPATSASCSSISGDHWFDFNDQGVTAVTGKSVEKYYEGRESAYMLYYRQKSLQRPAEAKSNASYLIPEDRLEEINTKNSVLLVERLNAEEKQGNIPVNVYHPKEYTFEDFYIKSKHETHVSTVIKVDNRISAEDLLLVIYQQLDPDVLLDASEATQPYVVLPIAVLDSHILHPITEIVDTKMEISKLLDLKDSGISLIPKPKMEKYGVPIGLDVPPLVILCRNLDVSTSLVLHPATSISDLYELASKQLDCDIGSLCKADGTHLDQSDDLASSAINNGDELTVGVKPPESTDVLLNLVRLDGSTKSIQASTDMTIWELCCLSDEEEINIRLRRTLTNGSFSPPLRRDMCVKECGLTNGTILHVEIGQPVLAAEYLIYFTVDGISYEYITTPETSVKECIASLKEIAGLPTEADYHLQTLNWNDEPAEKFNPSEIELGALKIMHGETVDICKGLFTNRQTISLNVTLTNDYPMSFLQRYTNCIENNESKRSLTIEINPNATVDDLKGEIIGQVKQDKRYVIPNVDHLRLCLLQNGRVGKLLKNGASTLSKAKIKHKSVVWANVLKVEELVGVHSMLLELRECKEDGYSPALYCQWEISGGATVHSFREFLATRLNTEKSHLHIAKYILSKHEWLLIDFQTKKRAQQRGKKGKSAVCHVTKNPYSVQDMDVIAYIISDKPVTAASFSNCEDEKIKEMAREEAEARKKERESKRSNVLENTITFSKGSPEKATKTKEVPLILRKRNTNCKSSPSGESPILNHGDK